MKSLTKEKFVLPSSSPPMGTPTSTTTTKMIDGGTSIHPSIHPSEGEEEEREVMSVLRRRWRLS